jgi:hypothetical protein
VKESTAFDSPDTLDYLCQTSGGHVRHLLLLICSACEWLTELPVTREAAERAAQGMRNDFDRALTPELFDVLRQIDQTRTLSGSERDQLLLSILSVLEYLNSDTWYAVNPAVRALERFKPPKRGKSRRSR